MKKIIVNNKGITLIALVVTIILLIILAGISISLIFGEKGIIARAIEAKEIQQKGEIKEALEIAKTNVINYDSTVFTYLEDYMKYIRKSKDDKMILNGYKITKEEKYNESTYYITVNNKYVYSVAQIENNVVIDEIGSVKNIPPKIEALELEEQTTNSIKIKVKGRVVESYEFYIKEENEEKYRDKDGKIDGNNKDNYDIEEINYEYENLEQGKTYDIKVVAKNKNGSVEKIYEKVTLGRIPTPTIEVADSDTWTKSKKVTITTANGYITKYTTDGSIPDETNGEEYKGEFTVNKNCTIVAINLDSIGQMDSGSTRKITKVDTLEPIGSISTDSGTNSIKVTVTAQDQDATLESGKSEIKGYYYSIDGGSSYTNITVDTSYTFTDLTQTSNYNIKVKIEDNAGNIRELDTTEKTTIVPEPTITIADANTWTKGTKRITISQISGYTIKYTIDKTIPSVSNGTTYTGAFTVDSNCIITAAYFDSTNQMGKAITAEVTKIDTTAPGKATINTNGYTAGKYTTSATVTLTASANDSYGEIDHYEFSINGGSSVASTSNPYSISDNYCSKTVYARAVDKAGNIGAWSDAVVVKKGKTLASVASQGQLVSYNGANWRVYTNDGSTVVLAGHALSNVTLSGYSHWANCVTNLNNIATNYQLNTTYATYARSINYNDSLSLLVSWGFRGYWLATTHGPAGNGVWTYYGVEIINGNGEYGYESQYENIYVTHTNGYTANQPFTYNVGALVALKTGLITSGTSGGVWQLVAPRYLIYSTNKRRI